MIYEKINIWSEHPEAELISYVHDNHAELKSDPRPAMIVCPGGGYHFLSEREAEPIVFEFLRAGMNVFLLRYSIAPKAKDFAPLIEAALSVKYVRENAEKYNVDPHRIFIIGFSAGGHLAASAGILWNIPEVRTALGIDSGDAPEGINRPDGMILSYPVITAGEFAHRGSIDNVSGIKDSNGENAAIFSLENQVDEKTSPAFIWHTFSDTCVPVQNSLLLADALTKNHVPFEMHIFPAGVHGLSLGNKKTWSKNPALLSDSVTPWVDLAVKWTDNI